MKIIIHRGTHQIGGCITEIRSNNGNRIAIDIEKIYHLLIVKLKKKKK